MLSDQDIHNRYEAKKEEFEKPAQISLVGHSLFDMWMDQPNGSPATLAGKTVANVGLSGTSTRQYLDVIIKPKLLKHVGDDVFIFLGVNDIVKEPEYSPQQVLDWLAEIVDGLKAINPKAKFYLLEATPVNNIATTDNPAILEMNQYFKQHCPSELTFIPTWNDFINDENVLDPNLCHDGLHFSAEGYQRLTNVLLRYL